MGCVDIYGIIEDKPKKGPLFKRRYSKGLFSSKFFKFTVLYIFIVSVTFVAFQFSKETAEIKNVIISKSEDLNKVIKENYIAVKRLSELSDLEPAAGEETEIDSLLDWEEGDAEKPADAKAEAKQQNSSSPVQVSKVDDKQAVKAVEEKKAVAQPQQPLKTQVEPKIQEPIQVTTPQTQATAVQSSAEASKPTVTPSNEKTPEQVSVVPSKLDELEKNVASLLKLRSNESGTEEINKTLALINKDLGEIKRQITILSNKVIDLDEKVKKSGKVNSAEAISKEKNVQVSSLSVSNEWVLKSAKDQVAWISKKGSGELIAIGVGDDLDGLGKIEKIDQDNGRWYVKGTSGIINQ